jgi:UDP-N-acetylmuramoyl-tripeptide--D-alanyl-D-alanine ligase
MIPLTLQEVGELCPGRLDATGWTDEIIGVQIDSRRVVEGDLFVAVGAGVDFCKHAFARGAAATLVPDDAHQALAALGTAVRARSSARFVAITGSMGKTTTKDILAALCSLERRTVAAERSYNAELGVPLTICRCEPDTEICILEMAMRGFGQIAKLCAVARPDVGVVTNIGPVHLEKVGDLDGVVRAKSELIDALPSGGTAIVPADFPIARADLEVVRTGTGVRVESFEPPVLVTSLGTVEVVFTARHLAANALCAFTAARVLGVALPSRLQVSFTEWRNEEVPLPGGGMVLNDAWNANPVSVRAALQHLKELADGRRTVAVLGEMAELGVYADEGHRQVAEALDEIQIDEVVAVGPRAHVYGGRWVENAEEALQVLEEILQPGDCVLIKGSRAMGLEAVADGLSTIRT